MVYQVVALKKKTRFISNSSIYVVTTLLLLSNIHSSANTITNHKPRTIPDSLSPTPVKPPSKPWNNKWYLNGITITPGGFFAGEGVWRLRSEQTDIGSSYANIPLGNTPLYTQRQSVFGFHLT